MASKRLENEVLLLVSIVIIWLFGIFTFGYRVLILGALNLLVAILIESLFYRHVNIKVHTFILAILYTLVLPPALPYIHSALGMGFGLFFGKLIFGGQGYYIFSPVLVGRVFLHVSFAGEMSQWTRPVEGTWGGLTVYIGETIESITSATPLISYGWGQTVTPLKNLVLGNVSGSIGEVSGGLILVLAILLLVKKVIPGSVVFGMIGLFAGMQTIANLMDPKVTYTVLHHVFSGGLLLGAVFIATDATLLPQGRIGKWLYGAFIGLIAFLIRQSESATEGVMFAILIGNMLSPFLDYLQGQTRAFKRLKGGDKA